MSNLFPPPERLSPQRQALIRDVVFAEIAGGAGRGAPARGPGRRRWRGRRWAAGFAAAGISLSGLVAFLLTLGGSTPALAAWTAVPQHVPAGQAARLAASCERDLAAGHFPAGLWIAGVGAGRAARGGHGRPARRVIGRRGDLREPRALGRDGRLRTPGGHRHSGPVTRAAHRGRRSRWPGPGRQRGLRSCRGRGQAGAGHHAGRQAGDRDARTRLLPGLVAVGRWRQGDPRPRPGRRGDHDRREPRRRLRSPRSPP